MTSNRELRRTLAAAGLLAALGLAATAVPAQAQNKAAVSSSESITAKVTVTSIDKATRHVVVKDEAGQTHSITAPPEARNFDKLKPGDTVTMTYTLVAEYVLSGPNAALPPDAAQVLEARTGKGERPVGLVANQTVVTGAIVAIDTDRHTLRLVSPQGGGVQTVAVRSEEGRRAMAQMKVGDTITAYITESMLLTVNAL